MHVCMYVYLQIRIGLQFDTVLHCNFIHCVAVVISKIRTRRTLMCTQHKCNFNALQFDTLIGGYNSRCAAQTLESVCVRVYVGLCVCACVCVCVCVCVCSVYAT